MRRSAALIVMVTSFSINALLWLARESEEEVRRCLVDECRVPEDTIQRGMHLTVYHGRRPLPGVALGSKATSIRAECSETRFMVFAPGGENPRKNLEPGLRSVGIRLTKRNSAIPQILELRRSIASHETDQVVRGRSRTTDWRNAFGARSYQPHVKLIRPGSGIDRDLTVLGEILRAELSHIQFDRFEVKSGPRQQGFAPHQPTAVTPAHDASGGRQSRPLGGGSSAMGKGGRCWVGADPGGKDSFGLAFVGEAGEVRCATVSSVEEALRKIVEEAKPLGVGIDAPMWWSAKAGSGRKVDAGLRERYGIASGTVQSGNSLRGAALIGGMLLASRLREKFPGIPITESHPKALLIAMNLEEAGFAERFGISKAWGNEHERDAAIAAVCAREGFEGRWRFDLAIERDDLEQDPNGYWLAPMSYFWPDSL